MTLRDLTRSEFLQALGSRTSPRVLFNPYEAA